MEKGEKSGKATESVFRGGWPRQVGSGNKGKIQGISAPNSQWPLPVRAGLEQTLSAEQGVCCKLPESELETPDSDNTRPFLTDLS